MPRVPFDGRSLDAIFEIGRGNLRATDDLAFESLEGERSSDERSWSAITTRACKENRVLTRDMSQARRLSRLVGMLE